MDRGEYCKAAGAIAEAVIRSVDLVIRLAQRSFVYLVAVYVLDPNLRRLASPFIRFENRVAEIIGKYSAMYLSPFRVFTFVFCDSLSRVRAESACHRI